jgi:hypothetical protein
MSREITIQPDNPRRNPTASDPVERHLCSNFAIEKLQKHLNTALRVRHLLDHSGYAI